MVRKFGRGLSSVVLKLSLYLLAVVLAVVIVFGTPNHIKKALQKSNIYNTAVDNALDQAKQSAQDSGDQTPGGLNFDQVYVRQAAKKAFNPQLLETSANSALDGVYGWLQQKTPTPRYSINLAPAKQVFANSVASSLVTQVQDLPVCTRAQLLALNTTNLDLNTLTCKPPGIDLSAEKQKTIDQIINNKDFLEKSTLSPQDLPKNDQGQTVFDELAKVPTAYHWLMVAPWILGGLVVLSLVGVILLFEDRRRGLQSLWVTFLSVGVVLLLSFTLTNWLLSKAVTKTADTTQNSGFQQSSVSVAKSLGNDVNHVTLWFALSCLLAAAIMIIVWWQLGKQKKVPAPDGPPKA